MKQRTRNIISAALSGFKYLIGLLLVVNGIATIFAKPEVDGIIFSHKIALVILGAIVATVGAWLILAKAFKNREQTGHALFATYLCFLFAAFLNGAAFGWQEGIPNFIASFVAGALYLRWKYNYLYAERVDKSNPSPVV